MLVGMMVRMRRRMGVGMVVVVEEHSGEPLCGRSGGCGKVGVGRLVVVVVGHMGQGGHGEPGQPGCGGEPLVVGMALVVGVGVEERHGRHGGQPDAGSGRVGWGTLVVVGVVRMEEGGCGEPGRSVSIRWCMVVVVVGVVVVVVRSMLGHMGRREHIHRHTSCFPSCG